MRRRSFFSTGLALLIVISSIFIFASCSLFGGQKDDIVFESTIQEKKVGILKSLGGMSVGEGTHILELQDRSTIRLRSSKVDLDNEKYISKKVEVRGPIATTSDGRELMEVQNIDIAEEEEEQEVEVESEKEYSNAKLGIKLTYLDSWEIEEEGERVIFKAPQSDMVIIERIPNPQEKTLESFLQLPSEINSLMSLGYSQTLIGRNQISGLKKESSDRYEIDIWFAKELYVYQLAFVGDENPDVSKNRNTFFSMVASMELMGLSEEAEEPEEAEEAEEVEEPEKVEEPEEPSEVVVKEGYRQFESLPYKFTGQYPSNWYFSGKSGGDGILHRYSFSNEPVEEGTELVSLDIVSGSIPSGSLTQFGENTGVKVNENGKTVIYITRTGGTFYKIHGSSKYESSIVDIASGIKAN